MLFVAELPLRLMKCCSEVCNRIMVKLFGKCNLAISRHYNTISLKLLNLKMSI